jgi:3-dehydrosphinganine reductase
MRVRFKPGARALITGGSSGLGLALARLLVGRGLDLVLLARRREALEQARDSLARDARGGEPGCVELIAADVADPAALAAAAAGGRSLDLIVNCAGVVTPALLLEQSAEQVERQVRTDLLGPLLVTRAFLGSLRSGGAVLNISSWAGLMAMAGYAPYCAAKAGLIGFSASLRRELLGRGISVHVACPMDIDTPMLKEEKAVMASWLRRDDVSRARPAEEEARKILAGLQRGRFLILTGLDARLYWLLIHLLPRFSSFLIDHVMPRPE